MRKKQSKYILLNNELHFHVRKDSYVQSIFNSEIRGPLTYDADLLWVVEGGGIGFVWCSTWRCLSNLWFGTKFLLVSRSTSHQVHEVKYIFSNGTHLFWVQVVRNSSKLEHLIVTATSDYFLAEPSFRYFKCVVRFFAIYFDFVFRCFIFYIQRIQGLRFGQIEKA